MTERKTTVRKTAEPTRFWEKISLVAEISARCRMASASRQAYVEVLQLIQRIVPFDAATLYLLDSDGKCLAEKATLGGRVEILTILRLDKGTGLSAWTAQNKKPILLADRSRKSDFDPQNDYAAVMSVPLLVENEVLGVLNLGCCQPKSLSDKHVKLMTIVADQFAVSIERLAWEEMIRAKNQALKAAHSELKKAQEKIIAAEKLAAVSELSVSINHEINNPLAVIVGNVQCMLIQCKNLDQKALSRLRRVEEAAVRIGETNRKLLMIDSLVSEQYMANDSARMINLEKSISR